MGPTNGPRRRSSRAGSQAAGRVIAGAARGIRLVARAEGTRPLGDRVKQTLFAILEPTIRGRPVLDLYAGSGAAGIEALSRGASHAVFVERDRLAIAAIERNLEATGLAGPRAEVVVSEVGPYLARAPSPKVEPPRFAVIVVDPEYDRADELDKTLEGIATAGPGVILALDGVVVAKHFWKHEIPAEIGLLRSGRVTRFGETALTFLGWADEEDR